MYFSNSLTILASLLAIAVASPVTPRLTPVTICGVTACTGGTSCCYPNDLDALRGTPQFQVSNCLDEKKKVLQVTNIIMRDLGSLR